MEPVTASIPVQARFLRRFALVVALAVMTATSTLVTAVPADAATQSLNSSFDVSGGTGFQPTWSTSVVICDECIPDALSDLPGATGIGTSANLQMQLGWSGSFGMTSSFDNANLAAGEAITVSHQLSAKPGNMTASAKLSGELAIYNRNPDTDGTPWKKVGVIDDFTATRSASAPCTVPAPGQPANNCGVTLARVTIFTTDVTGLLNPVDLELAFEMQVNASVTSTGMVSLREATIASAPGAIADGTLDFASATASDTVTLPCSTVPGKAGYSLIDGVVPVAAQASLDRALYLVVDLPAPIPDVDVELASRTGDLHDFAADLAAGDTTLELGTAAGDRQAPTVDAGGNLSGQEGSLIDLTAIATDNCGVESVEWELSDGTVLNGANRKHTFADDGVYTATVTAKDKAGNVASDNVTITISNVAPTVDAGPDLVANKKGVVTVTAVAIDPSPVDQASLSYHWSFGDGTTSTGASVVHTYKKKGTYAATVTVCDKDGACATDATTVQVD